MVSVKERYMRKTEFLQELKEALQGEVPESVLRENLTYYDQYISQEAASGRREEDVIEEIGSPRLIARTIIDSSGASDRDGAYQNGESVYERREERDGFSGRERGSVKFHYVNLNKWYWKALFYGALILILLVIFAIVGGIFSLIIKFAGPIILVLLIYKLIKDMWR